MKRATLILLAAIGMLLGTSKYASASDFSGNCNDFLTWSETDGNGNATVSDSSCSISSDASATGSITITADSVDAQSLTAGGLISISADSISTNDLTAGSTITVTSSSGDISAGDLTAESTVTVTSSSGDITAGALTTTDSGAYVWLTANSGTITLSDDINTSGGTVVLWASQDISAQNVYASGSGGHADVRIFANQDNSGSDTFQAGTAGASDGVGDIEIDNDYAGTIYLASGNSGGITYNADYYVYAYSGQSGGVLLDTRSGTGPITLAGGSMTTDGESFGYAGGVLQLMTSTSGSVIVSGDTQLTSYSTGSAEDGYFTYLFTDQVSLNANLTISLDGQGPTEGELSVVNPVGTLILTIPVDPTVGIPGNAYTNSNNSLSITGSGTLEWDAGGNYMSIEISGNGLVFTANTVINDLGSNNAIDISSNDADNDAEHMTIGSVQAFADTESSGDTPGQVFLYADQIDSVTGLVILDASSQGGANGGTVNVYLNEGTLPLNYYGNALSLTAETNAGGNGGTVNVSGNADISVLDAFGAPDVSVTGTGNGGAINVAGNSLTTPGDYAAIFFAQGNGSGGNGGAININVAGDLDADASNGGIFAIANAQVAGDGGNVTLNAGGTINIDGGIAIQVAGVTDGTTSGNGGTLTATAGDTINTEGDQIDASGALNGNGGSISFTGDNIYMLYAATQTVSANGAGSGNAGTITVVSSSDLYVDDDDFQFQANATGSGNGGTVNLTAPDIWMDGSDSSFLTVSAGTNGNGGNIGITADPDEGTIGILNNLDASGGSTEGDGGTIIMGASDFTSDGSVTISANAPGSGNGGEITITSGDDFYVDDDDFQLEANATGTGDGGTISITAPDVTADGGSITVTASDSGDGGSISISGDPDSGTVEIDNTLDASAGSSAGDGGTITLSAEMLSLDDSTLSADSPTSNGGNINLTVNSADTLTVGMVSAATPNDSGGGTITFSNSASSDFEITANGVIQTTTAAGEPAVKFANEAGAQIQPHLTPDSGLVYILPLNSSYNADLNIASTSGFKSAVQSRANNITISASCPIQMRLYDLEATSNISVTASVDDSEFSLDSDDLVAAENTLTITTPSLVNEGTIKGNTVDISGSGSMGVSGGTTLSLQNGGTIETVAAFGSARGELSISSLTGLSFSGSGTDGVLSGSEVTMNVDDVLGLPPLAPVTIYGTQQILVDDGTVTIQGTDISLDSTVQLSAQGTGATGATFAFNLFDTPNATFDNNGTVQSDYLTEIASSSMGTRNISVTGSGVIQSDSIYLVANNGYVSASQSTLLNSAGTGPGTLSAVASAGYVDVSVSHSGLILGTISSTNSIGDTNAGIDIVNLDDSSGDVIVGSGGSLYAHTFGDIVLENDNTSSGTIQFQSSTITTDLGNFKATINPAPSTPRGSASAPACFTVTLDLGATAWYGPNGISCSGLGSSTATVSGTTAFIQFDTDSLSSSAISLAGTTFSITN